MAGPTVLDLPLITDELAATDVLWMIRGVGALRDKQITADLIIPTIVTTNITGAIDLNDYKGDLVIFSTPAAGITLTFSNMLANGRRLIIVNKSTDKIITAAGTWTGLVLPNDQVILVSDATSLFRETRRSNQNAIAGDYTILDDDGYDVIESTTAATDRTIDLPTLADNLGREITIIKIDSGLGKVIIDGEGAETINNVLTIDLWNQYSSVKLVASASEWKILSIINEGKENLLSNGLFRFANRGASGAAVFTGATSPANSNDVYLLDQCNLLSDGGDVVDVSQQTDVPNNRGLSMKSLVTATNNKKFGYLFPIESAVAKQCQDKKVSLSLHARTTTGAVLGNIRAAVLSWDSTADAITSNVLSDWGASGVDPTLVANWTYENTPSNLALVSDVWTQYIIEGIEVDTANMNNLAVFIWSDDTTTTAGDELFLADVGLTLSDTFYPVKNKDYGDEEVYLSKFYNKTYDSDVVPGTDTVTGLVRFGVDGFDNLSYNVITGIETPVKMFQTAPTIVVYTKAGTADKINLRIASVAYASEYPASVAEQSQRGCKLTAGSGADTTTARDWVFHFTAESVL